MAIMERFIARLAMLMERHGWGMSRRIRYVHPPGKGHIPGHRNGRAAKVSGCAPPAASDACAQIGPDAMDPVYLQQISAAQEFLNENLHADISRVKCLLRSMLPARYHGLIDKLRQHLDPQLIVTIFGGQNLVAPNARKAVQRIGEET